MWGLGEALHLLCMVIRNSELGICDRSLSVSVFSYIACILGWCTFKMEVLKELTEQGKELGYTGEELQKFVTAQQERLREERMLAREREREERDFALRKLELESKLKAADTSDQGHAQNTKNSCI